VTKKTQANLARFGETVEKRPDRVRAVQPIKKNRPFVEILGAMGHSIEAKEWSTQVGAEQGRPETSEILDAESDLGVGSVRELGSFPRKV